MEDSTRVFEYMETTECTLTQEPTGRSYNRRSSILKPQKPRNPLQDLDFNPTLNDETTVTRKSRRVSFAAGSQVKEFHEVHTEVASVTVWGQSYEQTILNSGSGSDSSHHGDHTTQGDCSNIANFDALVTGKIYISERNHREDFENTPVDLRNKSGPSEVPCSLRLQGNCNNARGNGAGIEDRPLDLTLGTSQPGTSAQKVLSHSRYEGEIISGSMFQGEYSQHSIKTTFYGGDDEMDMSLSMREDNNDDLTANLFNKTGYVDDQDLSSSNEVLSPSGVQVDQRTPNTLHTVPQRQNFNISGNIGFTAPIAGSICQKPSSFKTPYAVEQTQQAKLSKPFKSHVVFERDMQQENTVFVSNMDFTEPVGVLFPLRSNYQEGADKTLFGKKMDLTVGANGGRQSHFDEVHDIDISSHSNYQSTHLGRNQHLDKTCYFDEKDMTKPVRTSLLESNGDNLDSTTYFEDMDMTRPVKAAMIKQHERLGQLNKTAFVDDMEITQPVNAAMFEQQTGQLNKTAFVADMEITQPVNAAMFEQQTGQLNKTAFVDDMEITQPVNAAMFEQQTAHRNKTAFVDDMEMTRPVNAAMFKQQTGQLNKTAFVDDMEMTRPVNAAMFEQTAQLNKTAFVDDMEITQPVNAAMFEQTAVLNKAAFVDDMEMTRPVNAAMFEQQTAHLNKTAFVDDMEMTRPVNAAMFEQQTGQLNKTAFVDDMEMTRPVNAAMFEQTAQLNKTAFVDDMENTQPVNAAMFEQTAHLNKTAFVDDMEMTRPVNAAMFEQQTAHLNKTAFVDDMEMTRPVNAAMFEQQTAQLNKTAFVDDMEMTRPVNAAMFEQQTAHLNKTAFVDDMEITQPVNAAMFEQQTAQLNKTAFVDDMEITQPVNAAMFEQQTAHLNKTAFVDDMEITQPVNAAMFEQTAHLNKTAFVDDMEMTRPVNAAMFEQQTAHLNKTAFVDDMEMTRPVNAAMFTQQTAHLNKTAFVDDMEMTRPGNAAMFKQQTAHLNKTAFVDDMEMTRPVNAAMFEQQTAHLNKTAFVDDMEMTRPVNAAMFKQQTAHLNKTAFVDDMEMTRPVNAAMFEQQTAHLNKTAFVDDMEMTRPVNAAMFEQQTAHLNKTAFVDDMEMTRSVNAAMFEQTAQLNKTSFVDDMEMTRSVNTAVIKQRTVQLNQTALVEDMEITRPVNAAMIVQRSVRLNQNAFVDERGVTKLVSSALSNNYGKSLNINNRTCFNDTFVKKNTDKRPLPENRVHEQGKSDNIIEAVEPTHSGNLDGSENFPSSVILNAQMATQGETPTKTLYFFDNNDITEVTCTTFVSSPGIVSTPVVNTSCLGESKMPQNDRTSGEETMDFIQANSKTVSFIKTFNSPDKNQDTSEVVALKQDIPHVCPQNRNIGTQPLNMNESVIEVPESSQQRVNLSLGQEEIAKSSELQSSLYCTSSINSDKSLQETLKRLNVLPVPAFFSKPAIEAEVNTLEIVSSGSGSNSKCIESLSSEADRSLLDAIISGGKEFNQSDRKKQHSDMKRHLQSETPVTTEDLCSPPKLICVRTNEEQVVLVETQCNFKKCEVTEVSLTDVNDSFPSYVEEIDGKFVENEAISFEIEPKGMQDISVSQSFQETSNSHFDLTTDDEEKHDHSDKMVTAIAPKVKEPETVEEEIKMLEKKSTEWTISDLEESTWTFSFFCETLDLVLKLEPAYGTSEQKVNSIHFTSHRTGKSKGLCHFAHKALMRAFPDKEMQSMCKSVSDVVNILDSISNESAKIQLFVDDFVFLQNSYGMELRDDQQSAYVTVTSYPLFSFTCLTVKLENGWESFVPDDIEVACIVGKTIQSDVIRSLAKGVTAGPHCLKRLFLDVLKYIENLEKFRPPGPLRWD